MVARQIRLTACKPPDNKLLDHCLQLLFACQSLPFRTRKLFQTIKRPLSNYLETPDHLATHFQQSGLDTFLCIFLPILHRMQ